MQSPWRTIGILAVTQIASWGSLYYAFSIVAAAIGAELHLAPEMVFGAFSVSLLVTGLCSTPVGILIDRFGGRWIMGAGSVVCGAGLIWLSYASGPLSYFGAWIVLGAAMALTLYEAAFATINRKFVGNARQAISTLTLFAGFASTIFWPLTLKLSSELGWRDTYFWFGVAQLVVCLPLHLLLGADAPRQPATGRSQARSHTLAEALRHATFWKLAFAFSANTFIFSALSVHLIPLLKDMGHVAGLAVLMATLIGPMQVAGRVLERTVARDAAPQTVGKFAFTALPAALLALLLFGQQAWAVAVFCALYGLSNGVLTIVRGTIPQTLFGPENYGAISGAMAGPSLLSKAAGPLLAAWILGAGGVPSVLIAVLLGGSVLSLGFYLSAVSKSAPTAAVAQEKTL
ncbi:MFS transporter [Massilia sp. SM-13]|uniref:MFS transporter n=1 Tax=Pseudoduganella rhizocola TaxID=3382643 RepID=UPI0038B5EF1D